MAAMATGTVGWFWINFMSTPYGGGGGAEGKKQF